MAIRADMKESYLLTSQKPLFVELQKQTKYFFEILDGFLSSKDPAIYKLKFAYCFFANLNCKG